MVVTVRDFRRNAYASVMHWQGDRMLIEVPGAEVSSAMFQRLRPRVKTAKGLRWLELPDDWRDHLANLFEEKLISEVGYGVRYGFNGIGVRLPKVTSEEVPETVRRLKQCWDSRFGSLELALPGKANESWSQCNILFPTPLLRAAMGHTSRVEVTRGDYQQCSSFLNSTGLTVTENLFASGAVEKIVFRERSPHIGKMTLVGDANVAPAAAEVFPDVTKVAVAFR